MAVDISPEDQQRFDALLASINTGDQPAPGFSADGQALPAGSWDSSPVNPAAPTPVATPPAPVAPVAPPLTPAPQVPASPNAQQIAYNRATADYESGNNPNAHNPMPGQTASGKYQITDGAYQSTLKKHPELAGKDRNDDAVMNAYTGDNTAALAPMIGRTPTALDLHAAHFLGANGAARFLTSDPNTPAYKVVSPEAVANNHGVFFAKDGTALTVGQVYGAAAKQFNMPPNMPPPGKDATGPVGNDPPGPTAASQQASSTAPTSPTASLFPSAQSVFGPQQSAINAYIAGQPALWQKLQALQDQYKKAATPTTNDRLEDAMNSFQQQQAVAQANMHASAGGVANNANPSAAPFVGALQSSHATDVAARQGRVQQAQEAYNMGSNQLNIQNQAQLTNLGLTGQLADKMTQYGMDTGKFVLQYGAQQVQALTETAEKLIPNADTRAQVLAAFFAGGGNPQAPISQNVATLTGLANKAQAGGAQINPQQAPKMMQITTFDPTTSAPIRTTVNASTPAGQAALNNLPPGSQVTDLGAPTSNVTVSNGGSGGSEGGGGNMSLADQHSTALQTKIAAEAALALIPYLNEHGGTGLLTDSPESAQIRNMISQAFGPNYDIAAVPVREIYVKLMAQVQNGLVLPTMKALGGRAAQEFAQIQKSQLGPGASSIAAQSFLRHVSDQMDWTTKKIEAQSDAGVEAKRANNTYFDPDNWAIKYQKSNPQPMWNTTALTDAEEAKKNSPVEPKSVLDPKTGRTAVQQPDGSWTWSN